MNFLLASFFDSSWFLVIILLVAIGLLFLSSTTRRKKEEKYRQEINELVVKGAKIRTLTGIYGTVVSVKNTTDGKIVLIESGEGDKKSYQQIHIDAIYGIDNSEEMVVDAEGNEVPLSELNKPKETTEAVEEKVEAPKEEIKEEAEPVEEAAVEEEKKEKKKKNK